MLSDLRIGYIWTLLVLGVVIALAVLKGVRKTDNHNVVLTFLIMSAVIFAFSVRGLCRLPKEKQRLEINSQREEIVEDLTCRCGRCDSTVPYWCVSAATAEAPFKPKKKRLGSGIPS